MSLFWMLAAGLTVLTVAPVLFALLSRGAHTPNEHRIIVDLYREQLSEAERDLDGGNIESAAFELRRAELERRLVEEYPSDPPDPSADPSGQTPSRWPRAAGMALIVAVPVLSFSLYLKIGQPEAFTGQSTGDAVPHGIASNDILAMVARLQSRLAAQGGSVADWSMLGRSMTMLGKHNQAADAYAKAVEQAPQDPGLLADYADSLAMSRGRVLDGKPMELVGQALRIDPNHVKALALAATAAHRAGDPKTALIHWRKILADATVQGELRESISGRIAQAESALASPVPADLAPEADPTHPQAQRGAGDSRTGVVAVKGQISMAPSLREHVDDSDTVFVFARAAQGPNMPLAIARYRVGQLPVHFELDDSMAMMPSMSLSRFQQVIIGARVSKTGSATATAGDLEGFSPVVTSNSDDIVVQIDKIVE